MVTVTNSFMNFEYDGIEKRGGIGERFDFNEFKDNEVKTGVNVL